MRLQIFCVIVLASTALSHPQLESNHEEESLDDEGPAIQKRMKRGIWALIEVALRGADLISYSATTGWKIYEKSGGYRQALADFRSLKLANYRRFLDERSGSRDGVFVSLRKEKGATEIVVKKMLERSDEPIAYKVTDIIIYKHEGPKRPLGW